VTRIVDAESPNGSCGTRWSTGRNSYRDVNTFLNARLHATHPALSPDDGAAAAAGALVKLDAASADCAGGDEVQAGTRIEGVTSRLVPATEMWGNASSLSTQCSRPRRRHGPLCGPRRRQCSHARLKLVRADWQPAVESTASSGARHGRCSTPRCDCSAPHENVPTNAGAGGGREARRAEVRRPRRPPSRTRGVRRGTTGWLPSRSARRGRG
jgi:hypothetical protein